MLKRDVIEQEEERLRQEIRDLDESQRQAYYRTVEKKIKDPDTYAVLNYLMIAGLHHFYLGRWERGAVDLLGFIIGIVAIVQGYLWFGLGLIVAISLFELYALFYAQLIVQDYNNKVMAEVLETTTTARKSSITHI